MKLLSSQVKPKNKKEARTRSGSKAQSVLRKGRQRIHPIHGAYFTRNRRNIQRLCNQGNPGKALDDHVLDVRNAALVDPVHLVLPPVSGR